LRPYQPRLQRPGVRRGTNVKIGSGRSRRPEKSFPDGAGRWKRSASLKWLGGAGSSEVNALALCPEVDQSLAAAEADHKHAGKKQQLETHRLNSPEGDFVEPAFAELAKV
jgi:hypothetical protein